MKKQASIRYISLPERLMHGRASQAKAEKSTGLFECAARVCLCAAFAEKRRGPRRGHAFGGAGFGNFWPRPKVTRSGERNKTLYITIGNKNVGSITKFFTVRIFEDTLA